jgi:hypothetical protein
MSSKLEVRKSASKLEVGKSASSGQLRDQGTEKTINSWFTELFISSKCGMRGWTGFMGSRIESSGGLL